MILKNLFICKILALILLFCDLFQFFCITAFAEPYTVTSSKGNLTFTLDEDWDNKRVCVNGTWWYFDGSEDCTYIWSEDLGREEAYKLEKCRSTYEYGMGYKYVGTVYKMNDKTYFSYNYHTQCYDDGYPASSKDTYMFSCIVFDRSYIDPTPRHHLHFMDDESYEQCVEEDLKRNAEESNTLNSDTFGKIVL